MKRILALLLVFYSLAAFPAETVKISAAQEKLAEELLEKLNFRDKIQSSFARIGKLQAAIIAKILKNAPDAPETRELQTRITAINKQELSWDNIKKDMITTYAQTYSETELKELNSFFSSPTGKRFIAQTPGLQRQLVTVLRKQIKTTTAKTRLLAVDFMKKQMLAGKTKIPESLKASGQPVAGKTPATSQE
ncbi:MAG: DUF2059 domain-containing protein [Victivallales bacterium]|nr:DUF2059 domain-containing protein [Victivallales bacterium]